MVQMANSSQNFEPSFHMQGWAGMGGANKSQGQYPGGNWNRQSQGGLDHMLQQNRQQMNNGNMGQLHIPQVGLPILSFFELKFKPDVNLFYKYVCHYGGR